jgi:hypothetical protein
MFLHPRPPLPLLLFPYNHFPIIRTRSKDVSEFRIGPRDLPHRARVSDMRMQTKVRTSERVDSECAPLERLRACGFLRFPFCDVEYLDRTVRRTRGEPFAVVVQLRVMLSFRE